MLSSAYVVLVLVCRKISMSDDFIRFSILQIIYENCYDNQLVKISTCVKYSIHAYQRYILPFRSGNLNSRDDFLNVMFPQFPNCFLPFPPVYPVPYFRFCVISQCLFHNVSTVHNVYFTIFISRYFECSQCLFHNVGRKCCIAESGPVRENSNSSFK